MQLAIVAGLIVTYRTCAPRLERSRAAADAAERDKKIENLIQAEVELDASRTVQTASGSTNIHPQKLRRSLSMQEVEKVLGSPGERTSDFRGGLHLRWVGAEHDLEASFDKGQLYCLRIEDRRTGHGTMVFESSQYWHEF